MFEASILDVFEGRGWLDVVEFGGFAFWNPEWEATPTPDTAMTSREVPGRRLARVGYSRLAYCLYWIRCCVVRVLSRLKCLAPSAQLYYNFGAFFEMIKLI